MASGFSPDLDLITRTLEVCGVPIGQDASIAEVISRLREEKKVPMEDVIDWLYEVPGDDPKRFVPAFDRWLSRRDQKPCVFCGNDGGAPCDYRLGWNNRVAVNCDLRVCTGCSYRCTVQNICRLHAEKTPLDTMLTAGSTVAVRKQNQWRLEQWLATGGAEFVSIRIDQQSSLALPEKRSGKKRAVLDGYYVLSKEGHSGELFVDSHSVATTAELNQLRRGLLGSHGYNVAALPRREAPRLRQICQHNGVPVYMRASL